MNNQYQPELDFTHARENNTASQQTLDKERSRLSSQVIYVLKMLAHGKRLQVRSALIEHDISHLPRRILDIEEKISPKLRAERDKGEHGITTYYFNEFQRIEAMRILKGIK